LSPSVSPETKAGADEHIGSLTVIPVSVTLPLFDTSKRYGTTWPAAVIELVVELFTTSSSGFCFVSLNVQIVSSPDRISRLSTPVDVDVPVDVAAAAWIAHEAESRAQPEGTASFRSRVLVGAKEIC
jgi:hypothetical protein